MACAPVRSFHGTFTEYLVLEVRINEVKASWELTSHRLSGKWVGALRIFSLFAQVNDSH